MEVDGMRLRNVLIAVNDIDRAIRFYKEIFGLQVILNQDGNVIMSEGLVLQDAKIWQQFLDKELISKNNMMELYFEEADIEGFVKKLEESDFEIEYVNEIMTHSWGQKVVRFYDPDGNLIEVGTPMQ
jgi:catechol 2,3-dioxygenase-like lactoylglutathione lyase family enzyme